MENRFLKRLQIGLSDLQKNPLATEVAEITRTDFEVFVRIFRHGLPPEIQQSLPLHNLADKEYLHLLSIQVESVLKAPAPEAEKMLANMPPLKNLELAYQKAHETRVAAVSQHQAWKVTFEQQIKQYNLDLAARLDQQLQKAFPSLAENPGKRKILVADMAQTIQDQGLPAIKGDYKTQAQKIIREVAAKTIRQYASEIEDLQTEEIASKPQGIEEKIITTSKIIAEEEAEPAFTIRRGQIMAETSPTETPVYKVTAAIRTSVIANLPPELAENEEVVNTITGEIEMQIHQGPQDVSQIVQNVLVRKNVQRKIAAAKIAFSAEAQQSFLRAVPDEIAPIISEVTTSPQFTQTPFAGSGASFAPGGGPSVSGPMAGMAAEGSGLDDVYLSQGAPLHVFTALSSPTGLVDLGKWLITAGPIRAPIGFALDSIPGIPKIDYFHLSFLMLNSSLRNLTDQHWKLLAERSKTTPGSLENYEIEKHLGEVQQKLAFLSGIESGINSNPLLKKSYDFFFNKAYAFIHPFEAAKMWALGHGPIAHLGISGAIDVFSLTAKYGGAGFAYGTTEYLKNAGILALKYGLTKLKVYKIVGIHGIGGRREFVFAPTYELKIRAQKWISEKLLANKAIGKIVDLLKKFAEKLGLTLSKLIGAIFAGISLGLGVVKWLWDHGGKQLLLFLGYLIATHGVPALIAAITGGITGIVSGAILGAKLGAAIGSIVGPGGAAIGGIAGGIIGGFVGFFVGAFAGVSLEILLENLWNGFAGGLSSAIGNFSLSSAISGLGLGSYAVPVLTITGTTLTVGYLYTSLVTQGAFFLPQQLPKIQSDHLLVQKTAVFSGKLGEEIKYTLTIGAKKEGEKLMNIKISDKTESFCKGAPPSIAERTFNDKIPSEILYGTPWQANYGIQTDNNFNDCLITNTATVIADIENGPTGEQSFYTATVTIGNPPVSVPSIWPLASGCITQGPGGSTSHAAYHEEAIDIDSAASGKQALATHNGTVIRAVNNQSTSTTGYGNYVVVSGNGPSGSFTTVYAHLQAVLVSVGQKLTVSQAIGPVGSSGNTGTPPGPHLHYEFTGLKLVPPYLPKDISGIRSCDGKINCNLCFP